MLRTLLLGFDGDQCFGHFCSNGTCRVSLHCQKVRESLDVGELTFHAKKTACYQLYIANQSAYFSFSTVNYSRKLHEILKKTAVCGIRQFHSLPHQNAECMQSCPTPSDQLLHSCYCHISRATHVPVGDDQLQHLELARNLARTFNSSYTPTFPEPQPLLGKD